MIYIIQVTVVRRVFSVLCTVLFGMSANGWSQTPMPDSWTQLDAPSMEASSGSHEPFSPLAGLDSLPSSLTLAESLASDNNSSDGSFQDQPDRFTLPEDTPGLLAIPPFTSPREQPFQQLQNSGIRNAFATRAHDSIDPVRAIPSFVAPSTSSTRIVRYEVPLQDHELNKAFSDRGIHGQLIEVVDKSEQNKESISDRLRSFLRPTASWENAKKVRVVRYEVPADDILFHSQLSNVEGQVLEPGMLRLPEVRFFQPKARVFMDLKQSNDDEFDLFNDGAILASLDVIELYFPMPLISDRFAEVFGKPTHLSSLGWRVGGTIGLGITTALNNGSTDNGSAPVSTLSTGIRYEFPLGRPSRELLETRDVRLDQRTRVGMEFGLQGGVSTREALKERADLGLYFGILVNTPWGG